MWVHISYNGKMPVTCWVSLRLLEFMKLHVKERGYDVVITVS